MGQERVRLSTVVDRLGRATVFGRRVSEIGTTTNLYESFLETLEHEEYLRIAIHDIETYERALRTQEISMAGGGTLPYRGSSASVRFLKNTLATRVYGGEGLGGLHAAGLPGLRGQLPKDRAAPRRGGVGGGGGAPPQRDPGGHHQRQS